MCVTSTHNTGRESIRTLKRRCGEKQEEGEMRMIRLMYIVHDSSGVNESSERKPKTVKYCNNSVNISNLSLLMTICQTLLIHIGN